MKYGLSKSRLLAFRQCPKRLWLYTRRRDLEEVSEQAAFAFQQGYGVGNAAHSLYPDGIPIDAEDLSRALADTRRVMAEHPDRPIFEATFEHDGVLMRADLLIPESSGYRMTEVKASTQVKDIHRTDCAVQTWVCRQAGIPINRTELAHVDKSFVYPGGGNYRGLLKVVDLTGELEPLMTQVPVWIDEARTLLKGGEPAIAPGPQCGDPYDCPFLNYCTLVQALPDPARYPIDTLPRGGRLVERLKAEGYEDLREVPPERLTKPKHQRIQRTVINGAAELDPAAGTRPYQQLVFQWSCHVETVEGDIDHAEFLGDTGADPRRDFAETLIAAVGAHGPIFVYNRTFEGGCLRGLATVFPDLAAPLLAIDARLYDLLPLTREHYYHPDMQGSWSIKSVLPTIAPDLAYDALTVQHGGMAQQAYLELIQTETAPERRAKLRQGLLDYCGLDTLALVRLARYFEGREPASWAP